MLVIPDSFCLDWVHSSCHDYTCDTCGMTPLMPLPLNLLVLLWFRIPLPAPSHINLQGLIRITFNAVTRQSQLCSQWQMEQTRCHQGRWHSRPVCVCHEFLCNVPPYCTPKSGAALLASTLSLQVSTCAWRPWIHPGMLLHLRQQIGKHSLFFYSAFLLHKGLSKENITKSGFFSHSTRDGGAADF